MAAAKSTPDLDLLVKNACAQSKTLSQAALALDCELSLYTDLPPAHRLVQAAMRAAFLESAMGEAHVNL